jgi:hypothetical protein
MVKVRDSEDDGQLWKYVDWKNRIGRDVSLEFPSPVYIFSFPSYPRSQKSPISMNKTSERLNDLKMLTIDALMLVSFIPLIESRQAQSLNLAVLFVHPLLSKLWSRNSKWLLCLLSLPSNLAKHVVSSHSDHTQCTTQTFQVFNVILFDVLKRHRRYELPFGEEEVTVKLSMKVYLDLKRAMAEANIWSALQALQFDFDAASEPYRLLFNEEKPRQRAGFREMWSNNFALDQLPTRRHVGRFNRINKPEWIDLTIVRCQKSEEWRDPEIHDIISKDLQWSEFFMND